MSRPRLHKLVYLAHPYGGDAANLERAKRWYRWALQTHDDIAVIADWILTCETFDDAKPENRARGVRANVIALGRCDELWLCGGRVSPGMQEEIEEAQRCKIHTVDLTHLGGEPPEVSKTL